jgi:Na+/proline symporter
MHVLDYAVLLFYLSAVIAVGFYFSGQQRSSRDLFLAGRSMSWFPVGLSVMATLLSGLTYTGFPGETYRSGFRILVLPFAVWLTVPVMRGLVLPVYRGLELYSVYEYLELRFDARTRLAGSGLFVVWRLLWLGGVLYAPCKLLVVAAGLEIPLGVLLTLTGAVATAYTFLGGMKAVIWTDVLQAFVMLAGLLMIVGGVWWGLDGGPRRVWEVAASLGRMQVVDTGFRWDSNWTVWGILPHYVLSMLSFYVADQITAQRYLTARSVAEARRSFVLNGVSVTIFVPLLAYVGVCLLAFYHDHPESLRAKWVANVDAVTRQSLTYADRDTSGFEHLPAGEPSQPLLNWDDPRDEISADSVDELVRQGRLLRPNSREPFPSSDGLLNPSDPDGLQIERLVMRQPPSGALSRGETVMHARAKDELLPWFIAHHLPWGLAGLVVAGVFAATMSSMDSGLNSIATLVVVDVYRHTQWFRRWFARCLRKEVDQLSEVDELRLGRWLTVAIGTAATVCSFFMAQIGDLFSIMLGVVNTFGAPLLGVFLLGLLSRRCTAQGALVGLSLGALFTVWIMVSNKYAAFAWLWPFPQPISDIWPVLFGTLWTCLTGYLASWSWGRPKSAAELRGLVLGAGRLGERR